MLAWIVERKLRHVFARLGEGDCQPMLESLAPGFRYRFEGDSPIGGERTQAASMRQWWARMYRLFPGFSFAVRDVVVSGPPWRMRIYTQLDFRKPLPDGTPYTNVVLQRMEMRWGRVTDILTLEDTQRCARFLDWQAARGVEEARAAPITDKPWPPQGPFRRAA
mgnify:CR=1 FL=1